MGDGRWSGVLMIATWIAVIAGTIWVVINAARLRKLAIAVARRVHLVGPAPAIPLTMPIERIAADLRRIRPLARRQPAGTPMARRLALVGAYDDALLDACRALGVRTELDDLTDGIERESERLRIENELEEAGLRLV
jgi:hypothetical protein